MKCLRTHLSAFHEKDVKTRTEMTKALTIPRTTDSEEIQAGKLPRAVEIERTRKTRHHIKIKNKEKMQWHVKIFNVTLITGKICFREFERKYNKNKLAVIYTYNQCCMQTVFSGGGFLRLWGGLLSFEEGGNAPFSIKNIKFKIFWERTSYCSGGVGWMYPRPLSEINIAHNCDGSLRR